MDKTEPNKLRVVVADDEEINLFVLIKHMKYNGYATKGFDGGLSTWEYLEENPDSVDMVILDKMMDDLSGVEVLKRMKSHPVLKNIPVMMQSGCVDSDDAFDAGADLYLVKPYTNNVMLEAIRNLSSADKRSQITERYIKI